MLKMVDGTGIIGVDMICPLGVSTPQPPNYDRVELEGAGMVVLPNSLDAPLERLELGGKTEQVQTSGENVWNPKSYIDFGLNENSADSIKYENNIVTYISDKGTYNQISVRIPIGKLRAGQYKISFGKVYCKRKDTGGTEIAMIGAFHVLKNDDSLIRSDTFTVDDPNADYTICFSGFCSGNYGLLELSIEKPMIATTDIDKFEPYTGGKPSPSSEYPQEIKNVGRLNEDTGKYEVDIEISGNFFDVTKVKTKTNLINNGDGSLHVINKNAIESELFGKLCPDLKVGETCVMRLESTGLSYISINGMVWDTGQAKTITQNILDSAVYFYGKDGSTVVIKNIRITRNTGKNMEHTPYRKPQLLTLTSDRPITKRDRLVEQEGEIGWLYSTKKYTVTGSEVFQYGAENYYTGISTNMFYAIPDATGSEGIMKDLPFVRGIWNYTDKEAFCVNANQLHIRLYNKRIGVSDDATMEEKFKAYKAFVVKRYADGTPFEVYYKTTKPEFVPLPQEEQNAIRQLKTYYPTTVITADGGELDPDIKVTYRKEI